MRRVMACVSVVLFLSSCGARTGLDAPPLKPGQTCAVPAIPLRMPIPGLRPDCFLGTPIGLTGGNVLLSVAPGGSAGASTDVSFRRFVVTLTWTDGGVACGSPSFPTSNTITIVFTGLRYRAQNNLGTPCVARSRIDFTGVTITPASPASIPLAFWLTGIGLVGPGAILLPILDGAALPVATAAAASCPLSTIPSGTGARCGNWSELPR